MNSRKQPNTAKIKIGRQVKTRLLFVFQSQSCRDASASESVGSFFIPSERINRHASQRTSLFSGIGPLDEASPILLRAVMESFASGSIPQRTVTAGTAPTTPAEEENPAAPSTGANICENGSSPNPPPIGKPLPKPCRPFTIRRLCGESINLSRKARKHLWSIKAKNILPHFPRQSTA